MYIIYNLAIKYQILICMKISMTKTVWKYVQTETENLNRDAPLRLLIFLVVPSGCSQWLVPLQQFYCCQAAPGSSRVLPADGWWLNRHKRRIERRKKNLNMKNLPFYNSQETNSCCYMHNQIQNRETKNLQISFIVKK